MSVRARAVSIVAIAAATIVGVVVLVGTWDAGVTPLRFQLHIDSGSDEPAGSTAGRPRTAAPEPAPAPPVPPLVNPNEPVLLARGEGMGMNDVIGYRFGETIPAPNWPPADVTWDPDVPPRALTGRPVLRNGDEVARQLASAYPANLRAAGIGGVTHLWIHLDARGIVDATLVHQTSGYETLDQAATSAARSMVFDPAMSREGAVSCWVQIPIRFVAARATG